jgi:hypothetical protein
MYHQLLGLCSTEEVKIVASPTSLPLKIKLQKAICLPTLNAQEVPALTFRRGTCIANVLKKRSQENIWI